MAINDPWKWDGGDIPPVRVGTPVAVYRYLGEGEIEELPTLRCVTIQRHEGPDPGSAVFRYAFDERIGGPITVEQALSTAWNLPGTVNVGDRLLVSATRA
ncbi:hypothetical protein ACYOEI_15590, partial [Singulisphaera rosea]